MRAASLEIKALIALIVLSTSPGWSQESNVCLSVFAADDAAPSADPDSTFWKNVSGVVMDKSVLGEARPKLRAEVRSRWSRTNLYFLFIGQYEALNLKANPHTTAETDRLWLHDCFEAYVGGDLERTNRYREFQMSPQGEFLDLDIDSSQPRPGYHDERLWNSGFIVKARIDETNHLWCGEMRIPFASVDAHPPQAGNELRVNFCRQDGAGRSRDFVAWQPTGAWTPHRPEKFGRLRLVDGQPKDGANGTANR
jgi:hypothetical protein